MNRKRTGHRIPTSAARRDERGFTMVEALVALVVLAIGLLGIAALYLDSLRAGRTAIYRTQAVNLAADLADRIRANRSATLSYKVALAGVVDASGVPACTSAAPCTDAQLAIRDIATWKTAISQALPGGQGEVDVSAPAIAGDPASYVVTIQWAEVGLTDPVQFELRFET